MRGMCRVNQILVPRRQPQSSCMRASDFRDDVQADTRPWIRRPPVVAEERQKELSHHGWVNWLTRIDECPGVRSTLRRP